MNLQRAAVALTVLNLVVLVFLLIQIGTTSAQTEVSPLVRTRAPEIVDESGKVRAQINVESNGEVIFRLRDNEGTIRSKYGADERGLRSPLDGRPHRGDRPDKSEQRRRRTLPL